MAETSAENSEIKTETKVKKEVKKALAPTGKAETAAKAKSAEKPVKAAKAKAENPAVDDKPSDKITPAKPTVSKKSAKIGQPKNKLPYTSDGEIRVELFKSTNGCTVRQIRTVQALGLRKINDAKVHKDNPAIRGMCQLVAHLVKVEKI